MDWRLGLFVISIIKDFFLVVGIVLVKFNDLKHMDTDMKAIKTYMLETNKILNSITDRISKIEGKIGL